MILFIFHWNEEGFSKYEVLIIMSTPIDELFIKLQYQEVSMVVILQ